MELKRLTINRFRNLLDFDWSPVSGGNILWGDNAQGKTAILESIYLLGHAKSFRPANAGEFLTTGCNSGNISCELLRSGVYHRLLLEFDKVAKRPMVDGKAIQGIGKFLGLLSPVLFAPEEVALVKGAPSGRRSLIDRAIFQSDPSYLQLAREFTRCLLQRNALLKGDGGEAELSVWTERFHQAGVRIRQERLRFLNRIAPLLQETYAEICAGTERIEIRYPHAGADQAEWLDDELRRCRQRERMLGQTLAGPQRDDPQFLLDGKPLKVYGSQGEQRSFMLALKTAQVIDLDRQTGESPVLLLDDMTSELDPRRRESFFSFLLGRPGQFFLTTTDPNLCHRFLAADTARFRVAAGRISENISSH